MSTSAVVEPKIDGSGPLTHSRDDEVTTSRDVARGNGDQPRTLLGVIAARQAARGPRRETGGYELRAETSTRGEDPFMLGPRRDTQARGDEVMTAGPLKTAVRGDEVVMGPDPVTKARDDEALAVTHRGPLETKEREDEPRSFVGPRPPETRGRDDESRNFVC